MTLEIDNEGTISLYQGDTGEIVVNGLDPEKNMFVFFAIRDKKRNLIGEELQVTSNNNSSVVFYLSTALTELLTVPLNANVETYYYGFKVSEVGSDEENTIFLEGKTYGDMNLIQVYPKQVEGYV